MVSGGIRKREDLKNPPTRDERGQTNKQKGGEENEA